MVWKKSSPPPLCLGMRLISLAPRPAHLKWREKAWEHLSEQAWGKGLSKWLSPNIHELKTCLLVRIKSDKFSQDFLFCFYILLKVEARLLSTDLIPSLPDLGMRLYTSMVLYTSAAFGLDYYTEVLDLGYLLEHLSDDPFFRRYKRLNEALIGLVEDYSLVSFIPLNVQVCSNHPAGLD